MERAVVRAVPLLLRGRDARGFTLVELLVSLAVLSVLAVGATLALGGAADRAAGDSTRFFEVFARQRALAVIGGQTRGLRLAPQGMAIARRGPEGWEVAGIAVRLSRRAEVRIPRDSNAVLGAGDPQIVFLPTGQTTAFTVSFGRVSCETDGWAELTCDG